MIEKLNVKLFIFAVYKAELNFIFDKNKLTKISQISKFDVYVNNEKDFYVVISGASYCNMSYAVAYLAGAKIIDKQSILVNIGIAGAKDYKKSSIFLINKITHKFYKKQYYPANIVDNNFNVAELMTVIEPGHYEDNKIMDMEAYDFFMSSLKFVNYEQIFILKIISDNSSSDLASFKKESLSDLINDKANEIISFFMDVRNFFNDYYAEFVLSNYYHLIIDKFHFTHSEKNKLAKFLFKLEANSDSKTLLLLEKLVSKNELIKLMSDV